MLSDDWFNDDQVLEHYTKLAPQSEASEIPPAEPRIIGANGVDIRCGPILRLLGTHEENAAHNYRALMLIVVKYPLKSIPQVAYKIGPADNTGDSAISTEHGVFKGEIIHEAYDHVFVRYSIELDMTEYEQKVRYAIDGESSIGYQFFLPGLNQSMNSMFYSCNGYSFKSDAEKYNGTLWNDVLRHHLSGPRYHVMIGGGDQIYSDVVKRECPALAVWLENMDLKHRAKIEASDDYLDQLDKFYFSHYMKWYGRGWMDGTTKPALMQNFPAALATIPSVNIFDDHDIIDGFGSYPDSINATPMFKGVGRKAFDYYYLFQHHTSPEEIKTESYKKEPSWITGGWGKYVDLPALLVYARLGRSISLLGLDCRSERSLTQIISEETYNVVFNRLLAELGPEIKHLYVLLGVPILYPRLVLLESILNSPITKAVSSTLRRFNVGSSVIQEFDGGVDIVDDMLDHWCSANHKPERNKFIARLQKLAHEKSVRVTFLGGDVHLAALGRIRSVDPELIKTKHHHKNHVSEVEPSEDARLMFNVVSSAIVNHAPPSKVPQMMFNVQKKHVFGREAYEDMVPLFKTDTSGKLRPTESHFLHHNPEFLNKRNYSDLIPVLNLAVYKDTIGTVKFPGPVDNETKEVLVAPPSEERSDKHKYHYDLGYPVDAEGIAATIHVEKNVADSMGRTQDYEVMIPSLTVKEQELTQTRVKYVTSTFAGGV